MLRARWFVVGFLVVAAVVGAVLNARGPFDPRPTLTYDQLLADFEAGRIEHISRWRERLEVTELGTLRSVVIPAGRDLPADLAAARVTGGVGIGYSEVPDAWLVPMTPWVPILLGLAALLIWGSALVQDRRSLPAGGRTARRTG